MKKSIEELLDAPYWIVDILPKQVPMKMIQDWLGHSDIQTTSNIYSHLDAQSKLNSAAVIGAALTK